MKAIVVPNLKRKVGAPQKVRQGKALHGIVGEKPSTGFLSNAFGGRHDVKNYRKKIPDVGILSGPGLQEEKPSKG